LFLANPTLKTCEEMQTSSANELHFECDKLTTELKSNPLKIAKARPKAEEQRVEPSDCDEDEDSDIDSEANTMKLSQFLKFHLPEHHYRNASSTMKEVTSNVGQGLELLSTCFVDKKDDVVLNELDFSSTEGNSNDDTDDAADETPPENINVKKLARCQKKEVPKKVRNSNKGACMELKSAIKLCFQTVDKHGAMFKKKKKTNH